MEAKLPINAALEYTPHPIRRMRPLFEDYKKKTRYNFAIYTIETITILSQQKQRDTGTLKGCFT